MSEDHNLSRCHILENPVTKFRNSEKMFHKILLQYANMIYAAAFENFLSKKGKFVWPCYLVHTPGRLGSAHPMPQLMIPARNQRLSSLLWTTSGPPESPLGEKTLVNITTCYFASLCTILYLTWVPPTLFSASAHKNVRNHLNDKCYEQYKNSGNNKTSFSPLVSSCR